MEEETGTQESEAIVGVEKFLNSVISVTTKDGRKFRGKLTHYDEHMNIILEDTEELSEKGPTAKHRLVLLKGGNISAIST
ncbi:MAG: LSM domain-containing protein [Methanobacteriota archaeon]